MKIITVVGARPQFIKAATVSRSLRRASDGAKEVMVHTGQHYDANMSQVFFDELEIPPPNCNLGIGSASHGAQTGRMLEALEKVVEAEAPDWVLVYGDTNSTLAGALAAAKLHVPVAHVEAGLRSFNRRMPEEINRVLTDHTAALLFAPTEEAVGNLEDEGITEGVRRVGDVMYDAALHYGQAAEQKSCVLEALQLEEKNYVLATVHRAENTDAPSRLRAIFEALAALAQDVPVVLPLHPRTRKALKEQGLFEHAQAALQLIDPVGYLDMMMLEKHALLIATDSGGVQKEAYFHRVSCVTLREETEWTELVQHSWNHLAPPVSSDHVRHIIAEAMGQHGSSRHLYGDGNAATLIVDALFHAFSDAGPALST